ncbi:DUF6404 family protein [Ruegeria atlantica]|uniref:DUF6404 family protein n=1 Tax=Ruegeria atlantica TaxID=81569 RepID=UPI00147D17D3|nr:DUF6404 family protein [Ruegeria atlantica]
MPKSDFNERLNRIEGRRYYPSQQYRPTPASSRREKLQRALQATDHAGISRFEAYPPIFNLLRSMGLSPRPLHFMNSLSLMGCGAGLMFLIFGGLLYSGIGTHVERGPFATLERFGWGGVCVVSVLGGIMFAKSIKSKAKKARLPDWQDL